MSMADEYGFSSQVLAPNDEISFSENEFARMLATQLDDSASSIQRISAWVVKRTMYSKSIVAVWSKELLKARKDRKLPYFYLANDIIQNSRKICFDFIDDFIAVFPVSFKMTVRDVNPRVVGKLRRLLSIWESREIYDNSALAPIWRLVGGPHASDGEGHEYISVEDRIVAEEPGHQKNSKDSESLRDGILKELHAQKAPVNVVLTDDLISAIKGMENSASSDAVVRERIAALPPEVSDPYLLRHLRDESEAASLSEKVDQAVNLLQSYNGRLAREMNDRKRLNKMILSFLEDQKRQMGAEEEKLESLSKQLNHCNRLSIELEQHLQSLPDISDADLNPLPDAKDLFRHQDQE